MLSTKHLTGAIPFSPPQELYEADVVTVNISQSGKIRCVPPATYALSYMFTVKVLKTGFKLSVSNSNIQSLKSKE